MARAAHELRRGVCALALLVALGQSGAALAQDAGATDTGEIVVMAQRRLQSVQDVPIAVSAYGQDKLDAMQIGSATGLQFAVPNLTYTATNFGGVNYTIRGIGASVLGDGADTGVAFHYNGAFLQGGGSSNVFYDVEAVEVLRGPQGTLFGRNATGGAVNLRTRRPVDRFEANFEQGVGTLGTYNGRIMVNMPLTDGLALRFAGSGELYDGDIRNLTNNKRINGNNVISGRAALRWKPGPETTIDFTATYSKARGDGLQAQKQLCNRDPVGNLGCLPDRLAPGIPNFAATLSGLAASAAGLTQFGEDPFEGTRSPADLREVRLDFNPRVGEDLWIATLELEQKVGKLTINGLGAFVSQDGFYETDTDLAVASRPFSGSPAGGIAVSLPDTGNLGSLGGQTQGRFDRQWTLERGDGFGRQWLGEMRVSSQFDGPFNFLAGVFYLHWDRRENLYNISTGLDALGQALSAAPPFYRLETPAANLRSFAVFGEAYLKVRDNLRLTVGLRWTRDRKIQSNRSLLFNLPVPLSNNSLVNKAVTGRAVAEWTPRVGFAQDMLVYGSYSRGFKGGGFNPQGDIPVPPTFAPEHVDAFELGTKTSFSRGTTLNLSAFHYDYKGLQISKIVNRTSVNENIDARVWGAEAEFSARLTRQLSSDFTVSYLHSSIGNASSIDPRDPAGGVVGTIAVKDINTAGNCVATAEQLQTLLGGVPFGDCAALGLSGGNPVSLRGKKLPNAPEWTLRAGLQYETPLSSSVELRLRADYALRSDFWGRIFNRDPIDRIKGWGVLNATAQLSAADGRWYVRAEGSNLLNTAGVTGMYVTDPSTGLATNLFLTPARRIQLIAGVNF